MGKRISWLDNLRGFAMLVVIVGHMPIGRELVTYIYSFHLPLFFIISGMSYKLGRDHELPYGKFVISKAKKLLLPYVLLNFLMMPLWYINSVALLGLDRQVSDILLGILYSNQKVFPMASNVTWFIPFMFLLIVTFRLIEIGCKDNQKKILLCIGAIFAVGVIMSEIGYRVALPFHFQTLFTAMIFFYLGHMYIENIDLIEDIYKKMFRNEPMCCAIALGGVTVGAYVGLLNGKISMHATFYQNIFLFYIGGIVTSFAIIYFVKKTKEIKPISFIGQNTLMFVAAHCPIMRFLKFISEPTNYFAMNHPILLAVVITLIIFPLTLFVNRYLPFVVGKKYKKRVVQ